MNVVCTMKYALVCCQELANTIVQTLWHARIAQIVIENEPLCSLFYNTIARKCYLCNSSAAPLPSLPATYQPTHICQHKIFTCNQLAGTNLLKNIYLDWFTQHDLAQYSKGSVWFGNNMTNMATSIHSRNYYLPGYQQTPTWDNFQVWLEASRSNWTQQCACLYFKYGLGNHVQLHWWHPSTLLDQERLHFYQCSSCLPPLAASTISTTLLLPLQDFTYCRNSKGNGGWL